MEFKQNDDYLVCDECGKQYMHGDCPHHGPLEWIDDSHSVSVAQQKNQARGTLPGNLYLMPSAVGQGQMGVFARARIEKRVMFGPFKGPKIPAEELDFGEDQRHLYIWDILEGGKVSHIVDGSDEQNSNWMRFVNCARDSKEQNLLAVQFRGEIYYKTCKPVESGSELLVWYSDSPSLESSVQKDQSSQDFVCDACGLSFAGSCFLLKHKSVRCQGRSADQANSGQDHENQADEPMESSDKEKATGHCDDESPHVVHVGRTSNEEDTQSNFPCVQEFQVNETRDSSDTAKPNEEQVVTMPRDDESPHIVHTGRTSNEEDIQTNVSIDQEVQANETSESSHTAKPNEEQVDTHLCDADSPYVVHIGSGSCESSTTVVEENSSFCVVHVQPAANSAASNTGRLRRGKRGTTNSKSPKEMNTSKRSVASAGKGKQTDSKTVSSKTQKSPSKGGTKARNPAPKKSMKAPAGTKRKATSASDDSKASVKKRKVTQPKAKKREETAPKAKKKGKKSSKLKSSLLGEEEDRQREEEDRVEAAEDGRAEKRPRKKTPLKTRTGPVQESNEDHIDPSTMPSPTKRMKALPEEKPIIRCELCLRTFKWKSQLNYHMRSHATEKEFKCHFCDKGLSQMSSLKRHLRIHSGEKPYVCEECGIRFVEKGKLTVHLRIHKGEPPERKYKCSVCDRGFTLSANLRTHMRTHTGEKPYPCQQCGKCFKRSSDIISHMRSHTGERPYKCSQCTKAFTMISHRNRHEATHTGQKPFKCDLCGKGFSQANSVKAHLKVHARKQARLEGRDIGDDDDEERTITDGEVQTDGQYAVDDVQANGVQETGEASGGGGGDSSEELQGVITQLLETANSQQDSSQTQNHKNDQEGGSTEQEISSNEGTELRTIATEQLQLSCTTTDSPNEQLNIDNTLINGKELLQLGSTAQIDSTGHQQAELTPSNVQEQVQLTEGNETTLLAL